MTDQTAPTAAEPDAHDAPPRLLYSADNPDGFLLEEVLGSLIGEMQEKMRAEPSRETALVITKLEEAFLWQIQRGLVKGSTRIGIDDPRVPDAPERVQDPSTGAVML